MAECFGWGEERGEEDVESISKGLEDSEGEERAREREHVWAAFRDRKKTHLSSPSFKYGWWSVYSEADGSGGNERELQKEEGEREGRRRASASKLEQDRSLLK